MFGTNISIRSVNWIGKSNQDPTWKKSETTGKIWRSKTKKDKVGQRRTNLSIAKGVLLKTEKKLSNGDSAVKVKRRH